MPSAERADITINICDAHHHLWDLSAVRYPWLDAPRGTRRFFGDPSRIQKNYLPSDFFVDIQRLPVTQSVHIQVGAAPDHQLAETAWVQAQIDQSSAVLPSAMVAFADLTSGDLSAELDQIQSFPGVRGVRQIVGRAPDEDRDTGSGALLADPRWHAGLRELEKRSLRFDLQLIPAQMAAAFEVFKHFEKLPVALCHCGSPWFLNPQYNTSQGFDMWRCGLKKLASLPNMHCKISGLGMFNQSWDHRAVKIIFDTVLEIFGPQRCMFGSNFPVDKLHIDYQSIWQCYWQLCSELSKPQKRAMFAQNCQRFYAL